MSGLCDVEYQAPNGQTYLVDQWLSPRILDRLNRLRAVKVYAVCSGHARGPGDREAHVILSARLIIDLTSYLKALSATEYRAHVAYYRGNGEPAHWHLEVRREQPGTAPARWWSDLVGLLEEGG